MLGSSQMPNAQRQPHTSTSPAGFWWVLAVALSLIAAYAPTPWVQLMVMAFFAGAVGISRHQVRSLKPFLWSLVAALIFVVVRVVYRVVFGAAAFAPAQETVLFVLPQVALAGPFASIQLFGVVTTQSLLSAMSGALAFATVFVAFGAANTLSDPRDLLRRAPRHLSAVAMSLAIALNVFPALIRSAQRIRIARLLRGERGIASLVVPLFEHAIERSERLGLSMAARGFGAVPTRGQREQHGRGGQLRVTNLTASIRSKVVLRDLTLDLAPGSITLISGATGSGKTSLLLVLRGMFTDVTGGVAEGRAFLDDEPVTLATNIGLTSQRPGESFVAATVEQELVFGPAQRSDDTKAAAELIAELFGIAHLRDRAVDELSAGEAALVSIAAAAASNPQVLLLDEPVADLDRDATRRVVAALETLNRDVGTTIVIAEHHPRPFITLAQHWWMLDGGALQKRSAPLRQHVAQQKTLPAATDVVQGEIALCHELTVSRGSAEAVKSVTLSVQPGTITALLGPNGCGKTTLLEALALPKGRASEVATMVVHNVDDLFFRQTVGAEARANDRKFSLEEGETLARIRSLLPGFTGEQTHPRDCSAGTRVVLAIALQLAQRKPVLLLDEPTRGLDDSARSELAEVLRAAADLGTAVLVATHDETFAQHCADRTVFMDAGRVILDEVVEV